MILLSIIAALALSMNGCSLSWYDPPREHEIENLAEGYNMCYEYDTDDDPDDSPYDICESIIFAHRVGKY